MLEDLLGWFRHLGADWLEAIGTCVSAVFAIFALFVAARALKSDRRAAQRALEVTLNDQKRQR